MGDYLSKPITDKESIDETCNRLSYGASSMQGWREYQEDAHNCIMEYDKNASYFAVYDGHGGPEVAQYCSEKLPDFIKNSQLYKDGDIENALIESFLNFDSTLTQPEIIQELEKLRETYFATRKNCRGSNEADNDSHEDEDEENVKHLYEEATMPIEEVMEKYKNEAKQEIDSTTNIDDNSKPTCSSKSKQNNSFNNDNVSSSSSDVNEAKCSLNNDSACSSSSSKDNVNSSTNHTSNGPTSGEIPEIKITSAADSSDSKEAKQKDSSNQQQNGDISMENCEAQAKNNVTSSSDKEVEDKSKKGKGKAIIKPEQLLKSKIVRRELVRNAQQLYQTWLQSSGFKEKPDSSDDSDEELDETFQGLDDTTSDDDDENDNSNQSNENDNSDEDENSSDAESGEEEEEEGKEDSDEDTLNGLKYPFAGSKSGCTAVVALLKGNELYVANAGDSRCIVCRNGKAVPLSFDHKPDDEPELQRIKKAGGRVDFEGRIDSGLNLSRAFGDHSYKRNKELSNREQKVIALPDIKTLTINPKEDEFMVLACDGIWNSMTNQEVVEFVKPRLEQNRKLSTICEEMFDYCLATYCYGDGTGCDNMTAIIVTFKSNVMKRSLSPDPNEENKCKSANVDTTV